MSLHCISIDLANVGRHEEALAASEEAVEIGRRLLQTQPQILPDLATSLHSLAVRLSHFGRREEALARSQEALDIYTYLAERDFASVLPQLAMCLNRFARHLADCDRHDEALSAAKWAFSMYRRLAETQPDAYLPPLRSVPGERPSPALKAWTSRACTCREAGAGRRLSPAVADET